ncbi:glycoside hydrolase family 16 protein [Actinomadura oligospora]|uniref:glycoside hydrolase family 16 protein n=1 Tax=Actinomadura oligospora TaxID=111804 RepID=UPI00068490E2|nr:glycoside hydrolase family 16 protein [Actinomadura oligospora]
MATRVRTLIIAVTVPAALLAPAGTVIHATKPHQPKPPRRPPRAIPATKPRPPRPPWRPPPGAPATAAWRFHWGKPVASDDFRARRLDRRAWEIYDGPGQGGKGRRSPRAVSVRKGVLTLTGRPNGMTGGAAWKRGSQRTGRWEARVRMSRSCASYHPVLLLWPTRARGGVAPKGGGGEVDWLEVADNGTRQKAEFFLHYGPTRKDRRIAGQVHVDLTRWHAFAVEWTSTWVSGFVDGRRWFHTTRRYALPRGRMGQTIQLDWFPEDARRTARGIKGNAPATLQVDWIRMYRR